MTCLTDQGRRTSALACFQKQTKKTWRVWIIHTLINWKLYQSFWESMIHILINWKLYQSFCKSIIHTLINWKLHQSFWKSLWFLWKRYSAEVALYFLGHGVRFLSWVTSRSRSKRSLEKKSTLPTLTMILTMKTSFFLSTRLLIW